jgi:hypothetical protein
MTNGPARNKHLGSFQDACGIYLTTPLEIGDRPGLAENARHPATASDAGAPTQAIPALPDARRGYQAKGWRNLCKRFST